MPSLLTDMIEGRRPCHRIAETARCAAVLEPSPLAEGHTLVFPKREIDGLFELDDRELSELLLFAKKVAAALRAAYPCDKVALIAYGLKVRHAHLHLVPARGTAGEIDLSRPRPAAAEAELRAAAERLRALL